MLTFAHGWVFWLAALPLVVRWLAPAKQRERPAIRAPFFYRVRQSRGDTGDAGIRGPRIPLVFRALIWLLALAALARPQRIEEPVERRLPTRDLLLVIDLSGSMEAEDFTDASGRPVDRLTAVKEVVGEFLTKREGDRVGLVVFGNSPFLQTPFTTDLELCRQLLDETAVRMAGPRTAFGDAIGLGIKLFENSTAPAKTIIALTDGNDTGSAVPPAEAARVAADRAITIHTVAIGDPETVGEDKLDEEALRDVAAAAGGQFFLALDRGQLSEIYGRLDRIETSEVEVVSHRPRQDLYHWPLAAALLLSLAAGGAALPRLRASPPAAAGGARVRVHPRTHELEVAAR